MMSRAVVQSILEQIRDLDPADRVQLADEVDRLAWRDRMTSLLTSLECARSATNVPSDDDIDDVVDEVRSETPLYERYWTRRQRSAH